MTSKAAFRECRDLALGIVEGVGRHKTNFVITAALLPQCDDEPEQHQFDPEAHQNFVRNVGKAKGIAQGCQDLQNRLTPDVIELYAIAVMNRGVDRQSPIIGGCAHHWAVMAGRCWLFSLATAIREVAEVGPLHNGDEFLTAEFWDEQTELAEQLPPGLYAHVAKHACDLADETFKLPADAAVQIENEATAAIVDAPAENDPADALSGGELVHDPCDQEFEPTTDREMIKLVYEYRAANPQKTWPGVIKALKCNGYDPPSEKTLRAYLETYCEEIGKPVPNSRRGPRPGSRKRSK
jgi:hypothetical protein